MSTKIYELKYMQHPPDTEWQRAGYFYSYDEAYIKQKELQEKLPLWCSLSCFIIPKENE